ncbi:MAG: alpha/beta hydrolase [Burkholderiaceae bacterium]
MTQLAQAPGKRLPGTPVPSNTWPGFNGVTIAGDIWGQPDGPLVVLQHGGGQTRHAWKNTGETLGRAGYYVVAIDARGHGDSSWASDGDYSGTAMVRDLCCVIDALNCQSNRPAILVGASMGGGTSIIAIGEKFISAAALILVDMAPQIETEGAQEVLDFMAQRPEGFASLEEVSDTIAGYQPHRKRPRNLDGLAKNVRLADDGTYRWHWDPAWHLAREPIAQYRNRMIAAADHLNCPTLLVRGGLSNVLSEAGAQSFLNQCPQAEYVNVGDAAHMVAGDRNDIFSNAVVEFLFRTVPTGDTIV